MLRPDLEKFSSGVDAVLGWDIDGIFCPIGKGEKRLDRFIPGLIPKLQAAFQYPKGPFLEARQRKSFSFLAKRLTDDEAVTALHSSVSHKEELATQGITVKNGLFTERPKGTQGLIFDQLAGSLVRIGATFSMPDLVDGYFDNTQGNPPWKVKPDIAKALEKLGVGFYIIEDKRNTATRIRRASAAANIYLLVGSKEGERFCKQNDLIAVDSPGEFVLQAYADIIKKSRFKS